MKHLAVLALSLIALVAPSAAAGQTTGSIRGEIVDATNQNPVKDAVVIATSPALQGEGEAVTDASGEFEIQLLPPGSYSIQVQREGYEQSVVDGIRVALGGTEAIRINMRLAATAGDVAATDDAPVLDPTDQGAGGNLTYEELVKDPTARDPWAVLELVPGVKTGEPTHVMVGTEGVSPVNLQAAIEAGFPLDPAVVGQNFAAPTGGQTAGSAAAAGGQRLVDWIATVDNVSGVQQPGSAPIKIADNASPLPRDRFFINYDYYNNTPTACPGVPGKVLGFEKTFFDGAASVEMRLPFAKLDPAPLDETACGNLAIAFRQWAFPALRAASMEFGGEVGGPILKDQLWFFGTYNVGQPAQQASQQTGSGVPADGSGNGVVDQADYDIWRNNFGATGAGIQGGDYNENGVVDAADYVKWRENVGQTAASTGPVADPSPGNVPVTVTAQDAEGNPVTATFDLPVDGGYVFHQPVAGLPQLNVPAVGSAPILRGPQDGIFELLGGSGVTIAPTRPGILAGASPPRAGRGADDPAFVLDGPMIYIESLGGSTGEVFKVHVVNPDPEPLVLEGVAAIEPVQIPPDQRDRIVEQLRRTPGTHVDMNANFYCLEFLRPPPSAGIVYRIASVAKQEAFAPAARALDAARRLRDGGLLHPDTNPDSYFHSIRQWALWTMEQSFDAEEFSDAFVEHAKKAFARSGREWTDQVEGAARRSAEGRWRDVAAVLAEAR